MASDSIRITQSLCHAELRTERALWHLQAISQLLATFYESARCSIKRFDDATRNRQVIRLQAKDPGAQLSILAGEVAHALRCALDHAIYSFAVFTLKAVPRGARLPLPVLENANPKLFQTQTAGVSPEAKAIIESLQRYEF